MASALHGAAAPYTKEFRVCADPNNMPFTNEAKEGFENKLAELAASVLAEPVTYAWHAQRRGFIRETLQAELCDVVMGLPKQYDDVDTTQPYYRSGYVFVSRSDRHLDVASIRDDRLRNLRIGVQLIGDGGFNTPPAHALAAQGMARNLVGYTVYGDYEKPSLPARIITAVEQGEVDIAAAWGPLAGYFAKKSIVPLTMKPITGTEAFAPLVFQFDIAIGVRRGDRELRGKLDDVILNKQAQISALLESYGVPLMDMAPNPAQGSGQTKEERSIPCPGQSGRSSSQSC